MKNTKPLGRHGGWCWAWLRWLAWLVFANPGGVMAQTASSTSSTALNPSPAPSLAAVAAVPASSEANLPKADRAISLNFQDVPLKTLLQVFADFSGLNLVAAEGVGGQVTVRLSDVPWPQALNIVLQAKGLAYRLDGRVLWVAPQDEWATRERKQLESRSALEAVSPLQILPVRLQHARAGDLAQRLQGGAPGGGVSGVAGRMLSARGSVLFDPRTNQLFVSDVPSRLVHVEALIQRLDVPIRQVMIEARIVEAERQFGESLGVRLGAGLDFSSALSRARPCAVACLVMWRCCSRSSASIFLAAVMSATSTFVG
jgi:type IV pilus assembly protein PilQ